MVIAQFRLFDKWRFQYSIWATLPQSGAFSRKLLAKQTSMSSFREKYLSCRETKRRLDHFLCESAFVVSKMVQS